MSLNSKKMVRLVLEEGRTIASVNKEYNLGEGTVRSWSRQFEEAEKEVRFLKKAAALFAKEID